MRLLILAAFLALIAAVCAEQDHVLVRRKNRDITQAINAFCGWTEDLVSIYTSRRDPTTTYPILPSINQDIHEADHNEHTQVVPSTKALQGAASKNGRANVRFRGDCNPKQWVPRK